MLVKRLPLLKKIWKWILYLLYAFVLFAIKVTFVVASTFTILNFMMVALSPFFQFHTVDTRSMLPTMDSGDVLFMYSETSFSNKAAWSFRAGDIVLVNMEIAANRSYHTIRRLTSVEQLESGAKIMTKADHYLANDQFVYMRERPWGSKENIVGKVLLNLSPFIKADLEIQDPYHVCIALILPLILW